MKKRSAKSPAKRGALLSESLFQARSSTVKIKYLLYLRSM
ncbi:MAG: DUF6783 domain-containing protein [Ruminococcus sp.]